MYHLLHPHDVLPSTSSTKETIFRWLVSNENDLNAQPPLAYSRHKIRHSLISYFSSSRVVSHPFGFKSISKSLRE